MCDTSWELSSDRCSVVQLSAAKSIRITFSHYSNPAECLTELYTDFSLLGLVEVQQLTDQETFSKHKHICENVRN